jgi:hypothetical protein
VIEIGRGQVYTGSQESDELLSAITADASLNGLYDIIVDDGSHLAPHVLKAYSKLWHALKPGGIYVIEDLHVSNSKAWISDKSLSVAPLLHQAIEQVMCRSSEVHLWFENAENFCRSTTLDIVNVDCAPEICVIVKGMPWPYNQISHVKHSGT